MAAGGICDLGEVASRRSMHPLLARVSDLPGLESLATRLRETLHPTGCETRELSAQTKRLQAELRRQRARFIVSRLTEDVLEDVVATFEEKIEEGAAVRSEVEEAVTKKLKSLLCATQLQDYVHLLGDLSGANLLGIGPGSLLAAPLSSDQREVVLAEMEELLMERCSVLLGQLQEQPLLNAREKFERAIRLPEMIQAELDTLEQQQQKKKVTESRVKWSYLNELCKNFNLLKKLATHQMGYSAERSQLNTKYLAVKCKTLGLKLRCLELEILASSYNPDTVPALRKIRQHLDACTAKVNADLEKTKARLLQYDALEDMETVVTEYAALMEQIEGKKWALRELNKPV